MGRLVHTAKHRIDRMLKSKSDSVPLPECQVTVHVLGRMFGAIKIEGSWQTETNNAFL